MLLSSTRDLEIQLNFKKVFHLSVFRSSLLNHMAREHSFSIGLPDNIVYCKQFLETLQNKLDK